MRSLRIVAIWLVVAGGGAVGLAGLCACTRHGAQPPGAAAAAAAAVAPSAAAFQPASCGVAALLALVERVAPVRAGALRRILAADPRAAQSQCSLADLSGWAAAAGVRTSAVQLAPADLLQLPPPMIVHLRPGHFALLAQINAETVELNAPGDGVRRVSRADLERACTGFALCPLQGAARGAG